MKEIKKLEDLKSKFKSEGKATYLNKPEHIAAFAVMNEQMEAVRREFHVKDLNSQLKASEVTLTN